RNGDRPAQVLDPGDREPEREPDPGEAAEGDEDQLQPQRDVEAAVVLGKLLGDGEAVAVAGDDRKRVVELRGPRKRPDRAVAVGRAPAVAVGPDRAVPVCGDVAAGGGRAVAVGGELAVAVGRDTTTAVGVAVLAVAVPALAIARASARRGGGGIVLFAET